MIFVNTDAGRSASRRPKQRNDCTVRAIVMVTSFSYDKVYDDIAKAGRKCGNGFDFRTWAKSGPYYGHSFVWKAFQAVPGQSRVNPWSFAEAHPKGTYVLRTAKHVLACVDGILYDDCRPDVGRCVYGVWEVRRGM